jgi:uncharacterized protein YodC (DUF2158 family)
LWNTHVFTNRRFEMSEQRFKPGDRVNHKAKGSPKGMAVTKVYKDTGGSTMVRCEWWVNGELKKEAFPPDVLEPDTPPQPKRPYRGGAAGGQSPATNPPGEHPFSGQSGLDEPQ